MKKPRPVVLCVLDGWGEREETADNAIALARTPVWDRLKATCPHARIDASEEHVGLPEGQMGNSEVGHMNLGAGRVVMQDLPRIDKAIADGSIATNPVFREFVAAMKASGGTVHLLGLLSPGGVHSHQDQMAALVRLLADEGVPTVVHAFLDGRDTPPKSALGYLDRFRERAPEAIFATVTGRYYAMDRDKRWDRVARAYEVMVDGRGDAAPDARHAVAAAYGREETDEFVPPTAIAEYGGMKDGDGILVANFRADRIREILAALLDPDFDGFPRPRRAKFAAAVGMTEYATTLNRFLQTLFPPDVLRNVLGEVVARQGMTQLRIAETEKYAHVTFFFNGGEERTFEGEDRILVPSPKVATYDLQPEMSAAEVTDRLIAAIAQGRYDFIVVNYANTDMVGHSGRLDAAIVAVEAVDACLGRLEDAVRKAGGALLITADHGNAEMMSDPETGQAHTAHTRNLVPLLLVAPDVEGRRLRDGKLADIAPTLLSLMKVSPPVEMTGRSLLAETGESRAAE